jgi:hypothetical protein
MDGVQYASATGTSWQKTDLTNVTLAPGQYYLIQEALGAGGTTALPTPDATGTIAMSGTAGKVALLNTNVLIVSGTSCPTGPTLVDLVGFGTTQTALKAAVLFSPRQIQMLLRAAEAVLTIITMRPILLQVYQIRNTAAKSMFGSACFICFSYCRNKC